METQNKISVEAKYTIAGLMKAEETTALHFHLKPVYIYVDDDTYDIIKEIANLPNDPIRSSLRNSFKVENNLVYFNDIIVIPIENQTITSPVMYAVGRVNEVYVHLTKLTDGKWTVVYVNEAYKQK